MSTVYKAVTFTGSQVVFTVPPNVVSIRFECYGGPGATSFFGASNSGYDDSAWQVSFFPSGGYTPNANGGGYVAGTLAVTPGDTYYLTVGGGGVGTASGQFGNHGVQAAGGGGYNGGGAGGAGYNPTTGVYSTQAAFSGGAGGGGATDVRHGGSALANRILVAGGSGGEGGGTGTYGSQSGVSSPKSVGANPTTPSPPYGAANPPVAGSFSATDYVTGGVGKGGWGGTTTGGVAGSGTTAVTSGNPGIETPTTGGSGGTQVAGGAAGAAHGSFGVAGTAGALGTAGHGGIATSTDATNGYGHGGGGGGGGYYGGGGGGTGGYSATTSFGAGGGGGGGSNYIDPSFSATSNQPHAFPPIAGGALGIGGMIAITYVQPPNAPNVQTPQNFSSFDVTQPLNVVFTFSSPDPAAEDGGNFDIEYQDVTGGGGFTLLHATGDSYQFAANFFTTGHVYNIQVRQYDTAGTVSPWTALQVTAVTPPVAPVITAPTVGQVESSTSFNVTWTQGSGSPELIYQVTALSATGQVIFDTGPVNAPSRINFCPNPSAEVDTSSWVATGGAVLTSSTSFASIGTHSLKIAWATSTVSSVYIPVATIPGLQYVFGCAATDNNPIDAGLQVSVQNPTDLVPFLDGDVIGASSWPTLGTFTRGAVSFVAQESVTWFILTPGSGSTTSGQITYVDAVLCEINPTGAEFLYFDGTALNGNTGTNSWIGTSGKSTSKLVNSDVLTHAVTWPGLSQTGCNMYVRYATIASAGIFSPYDINAFSVNINPPGAPTATITPDNTAGTVTLAITTSDTPNATVYCDVFRTDLTHGTPEIRLATQLVPVAHHVTFVDYTAGTKTLYGYRVRSYSATLGFADLT